MKTFRAIVPVSGWVEVEVRTRSRQEAERKIRTLKWDREMKRHVPYHPTVIKLWELDP